MKTLFSIIIPTYNRGYVLWKTILRVKEQTYPNWELLIIDDGSTDNTKRVVAEFQKDPRIKYVRLPHKGEQVARNKGLELAKGSIIAYVDSDDAIYDNFLSVALEYFQKNPKKVFATSNFNRRIETYDDDYKLVDLVRSNCLQKDAITLKDFYHRHIEPCGTGIFLRRSVIKRGAKWDENIKIFQDWDFILQMGSQFPNGYMHIPLVLFEYCRRFGIEGIISQSTFLDWANGYKAIYKKHKNDPLLKGQTWYPQYYEKYIDLHEKSIRGEAKIVAHNHFPFEN